MLVSHPKTYASVLGGRKLKYLTCGCTYTASLKCRLKVLGLVKSGGFEGTSPSSNLC